MIAQLVYQNGISVRYEAVEISFSPQNMNGFPLESKKYSVIPPNKHLVKGD